MTRDEIAKGIANRFVHSRAYILLYLIMASLSITTVVLSMVNGCPGLPFYILEVIINTVMILEVSIRFIAFGRVRNVMPYSRASIYPGLPAILEIMVECCGSHPYYILRRYALGHLLRRLWKHE